jgi:transcriptional regulator with XRE-family HTH domain
MTWKKDEEITKLINDNSTKQRSRVTITRWRNKSRYPNYEEVREIEKNLGIPFDVLYRDVDFDELIEELQKQIKEVKKMKIEQKVREEITKA